MFLLAQADSSGGAGFGWLIYLVIFGGILYFFMIRPQRNRVRQQQQLASQLEVGDQVRTVGGLLGVVIGIESDAVVLGIEEGRIRVAKGAIGGRVTADEPADGSGDEG